MNKWIKRLIYCLIIVSLFTPIILQYTLKWNFIKSNRIDIGIYGIYVLVYISIQIIFSILNRKKSFVKFTKDVFHSKKSINILVVGYREDPVLFENCLESIKKCSLETLNLNKVYVIIDGQENEDLYMVDIFNKVFQEESKYINLTTETLYKTTFETLNKKFICITQKHFGKRKVLYTGFKMSLIEKNTFGKSIKAIVCTDSDTELNTNSVNELYKCLEFNEIAAATGYVSIFNRHTSIISFLSSLRYWFACNLERGYQSFNNCVLCVSGPLGIYNLNDLDLILEEWLNQEFMGQNCTYGDDRHLTNKILSLGKKVIYTEKAICKTETPESLYRFYKQQIRWCKSAFREVMWNIKCIDKHSFWMTIDLTYLFLYSSILIVIIMYILFFGTTYQMSLFLTSIVFFGFLKGIYPMIVERNPEYLLFLLYGGVFISLLVPARLYALISMKDISWGTSSRNNRKNIMDYDITLLILWNLIIVGGIIFNIVNNWQNNFDLTALILFCSITSFYFIVFISTKFFLERKNVFNKK